MGFEDDLRRAEELVAEARRLVLRQKGLIIRLRAAGVNTLDAQRYFGYWKLIYVDLKNIRSGLRLTRGRQNCSALPLTPAERSA